MSRKLIWIDILNEQTTWYSRADMIKWFADLIGRPASLMDGAVEAFEESLGFMRRQVANLHFREPVDLIWLDAQLKTVSMGLLHHQGAQEGQQGKLPLFRARVKGLLDSDLLRSVKDTLLVQFAEFTALSLASGEPLQVCRCQGLHKAGSTRPLPGSATYPPAMEQRWLKEIVPAKASSTADQADSERCPLLIQASEQTRFCGDACRLASELNAGQAQEPALAAEKQRRYRKRQEK